MEKEQLAVTGGWQIRDKAPCYSWLEDDSYSSLGTLLDAQRTDAQIDITGQNSARMESHMSAGAYQGATGVCVE